MFGRKRVARVDMVPQSWLDARDRRIAELEAQDQRWRDEIDLFIAEHGRPYPDQGSSSRTFATGWATHTVRWWCSECRTPWPCKTFNRLRSIFGVAHEWKPDTVPYAPMELHLAEADDPSIRPATESPGSDLSDPAGGRP